MSGSMSVEDILRMLRDSQTAQIMPSPRATPAAPPQGVPGAMPMAQAKAAIADPYLGMAAPPTVPVPRPADYNAGHGDKNNMRMYMVGQAAPDAQGRVSLVPNVNGLSELDEVAEAERTGRHMGQFNSPDAASSFMSVLHKMADYLYPRPDDGRTKAGPAGGPRRWVSPGLARAALAPVAAQGRNGDTMLAHVNPEEAAMLKARGGSGTTNPSTGLPEFFGNIEGSVGGDQGGGPQAPGATDGAGGAGSGQGGLNALPEVQVGPGSNATNVNAAMNPTAEKLGSAAAQPSTGPGVDRGFFGDLVQGWHDTQPSRTSTSGIVGSLATTMMGGPASLAMLGPQALGALVAAMGGQGISQQQIEANTASMNAGGRVSGTGGGGAGYGNPVYIDPVLQQAMLYANAGGQG